jgi:hypothetical protein
MGDIEPLPVPAQLEAQLGKCKSVRSATYHKSRVKSAAVRVTKTWMLSHMGMHVVVCGVALTDYFYFLSPTSHAQEIKESKTKRES